MWLVLFRSGNERNMLLLRMSNEEILTLGKDVDKQTLAEHKLARVSSVDIFLC